jgi:hypothetical protein
VFISQFSQGIDKNDFILLSMYEKNGASIDLPFDKNWKKCFALLFDKYK